LQFTRPFKLHTAIKDSSFEIRYSSEIRESRSYEGTFSPDEGSYEEGRRLRPEEEETEGVEEVEEVEELEEEKEVKREDNEGRNGVEKEEVEEVEEEEEEHRIIVDALTLETEAVDPANAGRRRCDSFYSAKSRKSAYFSTGSDSVSSTYHSVENIGNPTSCAYNPIRNNETPASFARKKRELLVIRIFFP
jgi:hypothetical protein